MYNSDFDAPESIAYSPDFDAHDLLNVHRGPLVEVLSGAHTNPVISVAQMYERKGRDELAHLPWPCRSAGGDYVVTVQLRVPRWSPEWEVVNGVAEQVRAAKVAADQQALMDRRAAVAAELAELDARLGQV